MLFDVDGTLIVPDDAILQPKEKDLFRQLIAGHHGRDFFREIRLKAPHSLVDTRSLAFVKKLQEKNIPTLAFTAAPAKIREFEPPGDWRVNELLHYGFDFSPAYPHCGIIDLPKSPTEHRSPLFKTGVLFSSFHPKGDILVAFLQALGLLPEKVIFIDDERIHVESVVNSLAQQGIDCIGIHYTAVDELPCVLNLEQAQYQIKYFIDHDIWLSDKECKELIRQ